jgi:hypothetical protein
MPTPLTMMLHIDGEGNGYPDNRNDYIEFPTIAAAKNFLLGVPDDRFYVYPDPEKVSAWVYNGERTPWDEGDPYPDEVWTIGPRGGLVRMPA